MIGAGGARIRPSTADDNGPRRDPRRTRRRERGVALIIVLWTLVLLSVLAGAFSGASRTHAKLAFNVVERTKAEALADAAVSRAIAGLLVAPENGGLRVDQTPYDWVFGDGEVVFTIADEGGKIDLNAATPQLLNDVFVAFGVPPPESASLANAVFDFRNDDQRTQPNGDGAADYRRAGMTTGPKNAPFERVDELGLVLGMPAGLVARIAPLFTVYSGAAQPTMALLPLQDQERLGDVLRQHASNFFSADGSPILTQRGPGGAAEQSESAQMTPSSAADTNALHSLRPEGTDQRSDVNTFTIHAEARTAGGGVFVREAVVAIEPDAVPPFRLLDVRQGPRRLIVDR